MHSITLFTFSVLLLFSSKRLYSSRCRSTSFVSRTFDSPNQMKFHFYVAYKTLEISHMFTHAHVHTDTILS